MQHAACSSCFIKNTIQHTKHVKNTKNSSFTFYCFYKSMAAACPSKDFTKKHNMFTCVVVFTLVIAKYYILLFTRVQQQFAPARMPQLNIHSFHNICKTNYTPPYGDKKIYKGSRYQIFLIFCSFSYNCLVFVQFFLVCLSISIS